MNWLHDTSGEPSSSFTLAIGMSVIAASAFVASLFGFVAHPVSGVDAAAFAAPWLANYSWRRGSRDATPASPTEGK